jgi:small subunit ribosomal protein S6
MTATATTAVTSERRAREYETIYVMRPTVHPDEADRIAARLKEVIESREGKLLRVDNWGRRRLAYPIAKTTRGVFVYLRYGAFGDVVAELERNLRLIDDVMRYLTVQVKAQISMSELSVDPEDVQFRRLEEAPVDDDVEQELAQRLGLVDRPRSESMEMPDDLDSIDGSGDDGVDVS